MTAGLTPAQDKTLAFLREAIPRDGLSPSYDEIMKHLGLKSKSGVSRIVEALEGRGFLRRLSKGARSIVLSEGDALICPHCGHVAGSFACRSSVRPAARTPHAGLSSGSAASDMRLAAGGLHPQERRR